MFDIPAPPKKTTLSAKIREDIVEELDLLTEFVQERKGDHISRSHVLEYILDDGYFGSQKREVKEYYQWKAKRQEAEKEVAATKAEPAKEEVKESVTPKVEPAKEESGDEQTEAKRSETGGTDRPTTAGTTSAGARKIQR